MDCPEEFIQRLIAHQPRLRAFVRSLLPLKQDADDVLQETNLVLCRIAQQYEPGSNFAAWALQTAYYQVLAYRQSQGRNRLIFNDEMIRGLADVGVRRLQTLGDREEALRRCLEELTDAQRRILECRYGQEMSAEAISRELGRPIGSIRQAMYRLRGTLWECIHRRLGQERTP